MLAKLRGLFTTISDDKSDAKEASPVVASLAIMMELAKADSKADQTEFDRILQYGQRVHGLDAETSQILLEQAREDADASTSLYEFTEVINEQFSAADKFQLVINLWKVAYADGEIDRYEEHLIRKVADLIYVEHMRFMEAKHIAAEAR